MMNVLFRAMVVGVPILTTVVASSFAYKNFGRIALPTGALFTATS
jgi:hypothetical protein